MEVAPHAQAETQREEGGGDMSIKADSLFERIGGRESLERVHKIFYDKVYDDRSMSRYFDGIPQDYIERQQTDFMSSAMGGPKCYMGHAVVGGHSHIYITEELFQHRHVLLRDSIREGGVDIEHAKAWMKIDSAFKSALVKDKESCVRRYPQQELLLFADESDFVI